MTDEPRMLILAPYGGPWEMDTYAGSRVLRANCGHLAWLSPEGEGVVDTSYTTCVPCYEQAHPDDEETALPVAGAVESIAEKFYGGDTQRAAREMQATIDRISRKRGGRR